MALPNSRPNYGWMVAGIVVVIVIAGGFWANRSVSTPQPAVVPENPPILSDNGTPAESLTPAVNVAKPVVKKPVPKASALYQSALALYGDKGTGFRIQFDNCHGTPGELTFKKGTKLMLDNRDDVEHTFIVAHTGLNIKAYDFAVITANTIGKWYITCDGGGAATIDVQK